MKVCSSQIEFIGAPLFVAGHGVGAKVLGKKIFSFYDVSLPTYFDKNSALHYVGWFIFVFWYKTKIDVFSFKEHLIGRAADLDKSGRQCRQLV